MSFNLTMNNMMMEEEKQRERRRVVIVPAPFQGHFTPMLQLASVLHSKGFSITIAHTIFNSPNPSDHPHFLFLPFHDGISPNHQTISTHNVTTIASTLNTHCLSPLKELLLRHMSKENIACIIYDGVMYFVHTLAHQLNLPSLVLRTTSATHFFAYHALHHLHTYTNNNYLPFQGRKSNMLHGDDDREEESWMEWVVPNLDPVRFKDLSIFHTPNPDILLKQIDATLKATPRYGVIFNTLDCLEVEGRHLSELRRQYEVPIFPIGPLHKMAQHSSSSSSSFLKEDHSCLDWLNHQAPRSVLYVSLGSIARWDHKDLTEMASGLANSDQKFLWVVREGINMINNVALDDEIQKGIEERGCIVKWAPQKEVLAHKAVGGFWSHCGWNSTLESLSEGIPMICQPFFGDQRVNSRLVCQVWRVGVEWSKSNNVMERSEIEKAVRKLMVDEQGKQMWQRAQEMKHNIMTIALNPAGSSYNALHKLVDHIMSL